jgi:site-specific DNA-methyltransferase (adenine-specific)
VTNPVIIGDATLYCGDAATIIEHGLDVDAVITDPVWPNAPDGLFEMGKLKQPHQLFNYVLRHISASTLVIILGFDSDPRFLDAVPRNWPFVRSQQLPYALPSYRGRLLGGDEMVYIFGDIPKGRGLIPGRARVIASHKAKRATGHPSPRADDHMEQLVGWWTLPGETILDPFMGTASTAIAAAKTGRKFIGIEIEPKYFDIACERIAAAYAQGRLFA